MSPYQKIGSFLQRCRDAGIPFSDLDYLADRPMLLAHIKALIEVRKRDEAKIAKKKTKPRKPTLEVVAS